MNSLFVSEDLVGYLMAGALGIASILFLLILASLIYHWHYYGISKILRLTLLVIFTTVGILLLLSAGGILIDFL